jgi:hypothetical protein
MKESDVRCVQERGVESRNKPIAMGSKQSRELRWRVQRIGATVGTTGHSDVSGRCVEYISSSIGRLEIENVVDSIQ